MGLCQLDLEDAVTLFEHPWKGPILIGAGNAAHDDDDKQNESLINPHLIHKNCIEVDDRSKEDREK